MSSTDIGAGNDSMHFGKILDLNILAMSSGRERTRAEFCTLLTAAGLKVARIVTTMAHRSGATIETIKNRSALWPKRPGPARPRRTCLLSVLLLPATMRRNCRRAKLARRLRRMIVMLSHCVSVPLDAAWSHQWIGTPPCRDAGQLSDQSESAARHRFGSNLLPASQQRSW